MKEKINKFKDNLNKFKAGKKTVTVKEHTRYIGGRAYVVEEHERLIDDLPEEVATKIEGKSISNEALLNIFKSYKIPFDQGEPTEKSIIRQAVKKPNLREFHNSLGEVIAFTDTVELGTNLLFQNELDARFHSIVLPRLKKVYGYDFDPTDNTKASTKEYMVDFFTEEATKAIEDFPIAIGWYDSKISEMFAHLTHIHPELGQDQEAKDVFSLALAVTSNGNRVNQNMVLAEEQYEHFKQYGRFDISRGFGQQGSGVKNSFTMINSVLDSGVTISELSSFMRSKMSASDLNLTKVEARNAGFPDEPIGFASGELADAKVYGATILGSKIGNFYMNMNGVYSELTADRWFMRSIGRARGLLRKVDESLVEKNVSRVNNALDAMNKEDHFILSKYLEGYHEYSPFVLAREISALAAKPEIREELQENPNLNELRMASNALSVNKSKEILAPRNKTERAFLREVFDEVKTNVDKRFGTSVEVADIQAAIWYPEKVLYESFQRGRRYSEQREKYFKEEGAPDFANAAILLLRKKGINEEEIDKTREAFSQERRGFANQLGRVDTTASLQLREELGEENQGTEEQILDYVSQELFETKVVDGKGRYSLQDIIHGTDYEGMSLSEILATDDGRSFWFENGRKHGRVNPDDTRFDMSAISKLRRSEGGGGTWNLDGTVYRGDGIILPIASLQLTQKSATMDQLLKFKEEVNDKILGSDFKIGWYKFENSDRVDLDLNLVVPANKVSAAKQIGAALGQQSLYNMKTGDLVYTGESGDNILQLDADQVREVVESLRENKRLILDPVEKTRERLSSEVSKVQGDRAKALSKLVKDGVVAKPSEPVISKGDEFDQELKSEGDEYVFYHYSSKKRTRTNPSKVGGNRVTGRDESAAFSGTDGATFFYTLDDFSESGVGDVKHIVKIPKSDVYPFNSDPLNLYEEALERYREYWGHPERSFINDDQELAWVSQVASELGYKMIVARWDYGRAKLRANSPVKLKLKKVDD